MTALVMETDITPFPTIKFYGDSRKRKSETEDPDDAKGSFKKMPLKVPKAFESRISGPTNCWKIFHRQKEAFQFAQKTSEDVQVFAYEFSEGTMTDKAGQRRYLVTSLPVFWHYYNQLELNKRHHYEVIPEGKPCKLYFDLEYLREHNLGKDGDKMVDTLIKVVCLWLKKLYNKDCQRSDVLDLDSSTETKFSRHLIFQMEDALFANSVTAGAFVRHIFHQLLDVIKMKSASKKRLQSQGRSTAQPGTDDNTSHLSKHWNNQINVSHIQDLSWNTDQITEDDKQLSLVAEICEQSLTGCRNCEIATSRCSSSSYGAFNHEMKIESRATTLNSCDIFRQTGMKGESHETNVAAEVMHEFALEELTSMLVQNKDGNETLFCDLGVYTKNRNFRLFMSSKLNKNNPLIVSSKNQFLPLFKKDKKSQEELFFYSSLISQTQSELNFETLQMEAWKTPHKTHLFNSTLNKVGTIQAASQEGFLTSPYPEIDNFIKNLVTNHGHQGIVRHWTYFTTREILIYDIAGYRWCGNVQREHRSNNIM